MAHSRLQQICSSTFLKTQSNKVSSLRFKKSFNSSNAFSQVSLLTSSTHNPLFFRSLSTLKKEKTLKKKNDEGTVDSNLKSVKKKLNKDDLVGNPKDFLAKMMQDFESQMDGEVDKKYNDEIVQRKKELLEKPLDQLLNDFKIGLQKALEFSPQSHIIMRNGWSLDDKPNEETPYYEVTKKNGKHKVELAFPMYETEGDEEQTEAMDNPSYEKALEENDPLNIKTSEEGSTSDLDDIARYPKSHPCNVKIAFLDSLGKTKGTFSLLCTVEEDNCFYAHSFGVQVGKEAEKKIDVMKLTADFQTQLYALLEKLEIDDQMGRFIKQTVVTNRLKKFSDLANDVITLLD